jgi:MarR family transcriptional regulator for hemolysin
LAEISESFGMLMGETARLWRYALDQRLQPLGLTQAKWLVLLHLSRENGLIQKDLAIRVGVEAPTLVVMLDRMAEDGWITRRESSDDRRSKTVHITAKAQDVLKQIRTTATQLRRELLAGIAPKDIERCSDVLAQIKRAVENLSA